MSSDTDLFADAHDLWNRIKVKYFVANCVASTPYIACDTNSSKGDEKRWTPNDESTSSTGLSSTSNKCLIANNDGGDESDDEESTSSQGTFSCLLPLIIMTGKMRPTMWKKRRFASSISILTKRTKQSWLSC